MRDGRYEEEGWRVRKDGTRFWANIVITPVYDEAGDLIGFGKVSRDLTAGGCRRSRPAPRRSSSRPPTASSRSSAASCRASATTRSSCSTPPATSCPGTPARGASRATRTTRSSAGTSRPSTRPRTGPGDHPAHELEVAIREGRYEEEGWRVRKDGTTFWASVTITAVRDDDGRLTGFAKVTRDLTERKPGVRPGAPRRARGAAARQRGARPVRRRRGPRHDRSAADDLGVRRDARARRAHGRRATSTRGTSATAVCG